MVQISKKQLKVITWSARILSLAILLFALPFYFGYGNPMPFIDPTYTFWDNLWLTIFPFIFIGLMLGWKCPKAGGYLVTIPLTIGLLYAIVIEKEFLWFMFIPLIAGILYLIMRYKK